MKNIFLIGGGGFALEIINYLLDITKKTNEEFNILGIVDKNKRNKFFFEKMLKKKIKYLSSIPKTEQKNLFIITLGDTKKREECRIKIKKNNNKLFTVIHPTAFISGYSSIKEGVIICPNSFVGPFSKISENCVINVFSLVGHESKIGRSSILSPYSSVLGKAKCGTGSFLGSHSSIMPKSILGNGSKLSAGSKLYGSIPNFSMSGGNPAKVIMNYPNVNKTKK